MSSESLQVCFQALHCTGELVLTSAFADTPGGDPLRCAWAAAEADAALAYDAWQQTSDRAPSPCTVPPPIAPMRRRTHSPPPSRRARPHSPQAII